MMRDGSLDGMIGGYQSWRTIWHFFYNDLPALELGYGVDVPGMYYALRRLADELEAERGIKVDYRTMWNFVHRERLSFKKKRSRRRAAKA